MTRSDLRNIYLTHSPMLYGVALEITESKELADEILIKTFEKVYEWNLNDHLNHPICIPLLKTLIQTAQAHFSLNVNFKSALIQNTPVLCELIFENEETQDPSMGNNFTYDKGQNTQAGN